MVAVMNFVPIPVPLRLQAESVIFYMLLDSNVLVVCR